MKSPSDFPRQRGLTTSDCLPSGLSVVLTKFHPTASENGPLVKTVTAATVRAACSMRQAAKAERWDGKTLWADWLERFKKRSDTTDSEHTSRDAECHGPRHWEHARSCVEEIVIACGRALYVNFPSIEVLRPLHFTLRGVAETLSSDIYLGHLDGLDANFPIRKWNDYVWGTEKENYVDEPWTNFWAFALSRLTDVITRLENERGEHLLRISEADGSERIGQVPDRTGEPEPDDPGNVPAIPAAVIGITPANSAGEEPRAAVTNTTALRVDSDKEKQRTNKQRPGKERKGDASLLADNVAATFRTAEQYLGISERHRQNLMNDQLLTVVGKGHNRKITTESLRKYLPPEIPK